MLSEPVQIALIASIAPTLAAIGALLVGLGNRTRSKDAEIKLESVAKTAESVHTLVNSAMGTQLRIAMVALQRVADLTGNPTDAQAASLAAGLFREHEAKQKTVDLAAGEPAKETPRPII